MLETDALADETRTLRRISLLVIRAREDERDDTVADRLNKVAAVIDHMKRDIAVGSHASDTDVATLATLVGRLPKATFGTIVSSEVARQSVVIELRELVSLLRHSRAVANLSPAVSFRA